MIKCAKRLECRDWESRGCDALHADWQALKELQLLKNTETWITHPIWTGANLKAVLLCGNQRIVTWNQRCWNIWSNMSCKTLNLPCRDTQHSCNHSSIYTLVIYNSNIEMKIKIIILAAVPPLRRLSDSPSQKTESVWTEQQTKASGLLSSSSGE